MEKEPRDFDPAIRALRAMGQPIQRFHLQAWQGPPIGQVLGSIKELRQGLLLAL